MPRKLTCKEVNKIVEDFFDGKTILALSTEFEVSRHTIRNILMRAVYRDCFEVADYGFMDMTEWKNAIEERLIQNQRLSRGRGIHGCKSSHHTEEG